MLVALVNSREKEQGWTRTEQSGRCELIYTKKYASLLFLASNPTPTPFPIPAPIADGTSLTRLLSPFPRLAQPPNLGILRRGRRFWESTLPSSMTRFCQRTLFRKIRLHRSFINAAKESRASYKKERSILATIDTTFRGHASKDPITRKAEAGWHKKKRKTCLGYRPEAKDIHNGLWCRNGGSSSCYRE